MIKKNTKAVFLDGDYQGEYDWKGGIPLSVGETMTVKIDGKELQYKLVQKKVTCDAKGEDQIVDVLYSFELI